MSKDTIKAANITLTPTQAWTLAYKLRSKVVGKNKESKIRLHANTGTNELYLLNPLTRITDEIGQKMKEIES